MEQTERKFKQIDWDKVDFNDPESYNNPPEIMLTESQIFDRYWSYWRSQMEKKYGVGHELITRENCLDDYVMGHFATEVTNVR